MSGINPEKIGNLVERPDKIEIANLDAYDAGLLGFGGGGDVDWWQGYIRAELGRAHDFYVAQHEDAIREAASALTALVAERDELDRAWLNAEAKVSELQERLIDLIGGPDHRLGGEDNPEAEDHAPLSVAINFGKLRRARSALGETPR